MLKVSLGLCCDVMCCAVTCWIEMRLAALNCVVLFYIVEQVVRGIQIMTELTWILNYRHMRKKTHGFVPLERANL